MKAQKKAAIIFYEGYISVQPSVVNAAVAFVSRGYQVDLLYRRPQISVPAPGPLHNVQFFECRPKQFELPAVLRRGLRRRRLTERPGEGPVTKVGQPPRAIAPRGRLKQWLGSAGLFSDLMQFAWFCRRRVRDADVIVSFDMTGLAVKQFAVRRGTPFAYWSLEPMLRSETHDPYTKALKDNESRHLGEARAVVVQSAERGALLSADSAIDFKKFVVIPNGPANGNVAGISRSFYVDHFGISPSTLIVLSAGAIQSNVGSLDFAKAARSWEERFVLVLHERAKRDPSDPFIREVREAGDGRVILSLDPVPFDKIAEIYAGAHIGLVYYEPINVNYATGAHASGKLAYYLQHGLPVVVMGICPQIVLEYRCGIAVDRADQIAEALATIAASYMEFSNNARLCYRDQYDVAPGLKRLITMLEDA